MKRKNCNKCQWFIQAKENPVEYLKVNYKNDYRLEMREKTLDFVKELIKNHDIKKLPDKIDGCFKCKVLPPMGNPSDSYLPEMGNPDC